VGLFCRLFGWTEKIMERLVRLHGCLARMLSGNPTLCKTVQIFRLRYSIDIISKEEWSSWSHGGSFEAHIYNLLIISSFIRSKHSIHNQAGISDILSRKLVTHFIR
jgi:hypothetical protein